MAKLTAHEIQLFAIAKEAFAESNMTVVSIKELGLTIGICYTNDRLQTHMQIYVTQCGANDKFKFKRGVNALLEKFGNDNYIVVPAKDTITDTLAAIVNLYCNYMSLYELECRYL
jgi:hypothetical protein